MEENGIPGPVDAIANRRQDARERLAAIDDSANPPDSPRTKAIIDGVPVKRMGEPANVAHAVSFFSMSARDSSRGRSFMSAAA